MSSTPTSFASAAAGQSRGSRSGDDWSRRDGRSVNGTMTFRRTGNSATNPQSLSGSDTAALSSMAPSEPHSAQPTLPPFDGSLRYSRENLLDIYNGTASASTDVTGLFVSGWNPTQAHGGQRGWGKSAEGTIPQDPTVCWESNGSIRPIGTHDMTEQEKEMFLDVNSTLKPQQPKDANSQSTVNAGNSSGALIGRKSSVSHGTGYTNNNNTNINTATNSSSANPLSSISSSRPATRRKETLDTSPFPGAGGLTSPLGNRTPREESSWFGRKNPEPKESQPQFDEPDEELAPAAGRPPNLGSLSRSNTAGTASLWGGSGQATAPPSAGVFGSFALTTPTTDKRFGSARGESRLAHLLPKQDGTDTAASGAKVAGTSSYAAAPGLPSLASVGGSSTAKDSWKPRQRTDTDPFGVADAIQQPPPAQSTVAFDAPAKNTRGDFGMSGLNISAALDDDAHGSPDTNPFRSPPERAAATTHEPDQLSHPTIPSIGAIGGNGGGPDSVGPFGSIRSSGYPGGAFDPTDRSQTSSTGAKGFPGLGNIAGWGNPMSVTTPDRERPPFSNAFGASLFSPSANELPSAGFGGVPAGGVFGPPGAGPTGSLRSTTSKLNALFPASMQAQMSSGQESEGGGLSDSIPDLRPTNFVGAIGRENIGSQVRDAESRSARAMFEDPLDSTHGGAFADQSSQPMSAAASALAAAFDAPPPIGADAGQNLPRTMVMPDRMRWVYLDPQGQVQGPFTGLEMNDWYKAHFFTPDLRVKKVEDTEFEPLGQLIRRIGNSREPFLVPQMGVPHGQPSLSGTFVHGNHGGVVPPLVGAFPSYGRTLTAEEQNNLERRKQEEQYLIARQREMQVTGQHIPPFTPGRPGAVGVPTGALQHHSSAHSLQSQPSFGSMTGPLGSAPPHIPGQIGAPSTFFDHAGMPQSTQAPLQSSSDFLREEYNIDDRAMLPSTMQQSVLGAVGNFPPHSQAHGQPASHNMDPNSLNQLPTADQLQKDSQGFSERLKEFNMLREQHDANEFFSGAFPSDITQPINNQHVQAAEIVEEVAALERQLQSGGDIQSANGEAPPSPLTAMSLAHRAQAQAQAQAVAASKQRKSLSLESDDAPLTATQPTGQSDLPMPFPPPQTETTLAAPTAQRKSTLPDQFNTTSSRPETPDSSSSAAQPPPLAPWALQPGSESHRGPSLKEIQEAEAKKAAKDEEIAAAARRSAAEQEAALLREREKAAATIAPGLPTSSTWGNGTPTSTTAAPASPWAKAPASKASAAVLVANNSTHSSSDKKKTLAEIQREEEASKQKTRDLSSQSPSGLSHAGKRYADLASRGQAPVASASPVSPAILPPPAAAGWATVGAGGKIKTPTGPAAIRTAAVPPPPIKAPVSSTIRSVSRQLPGVSGRADSSAAMDEFNKWLHREVSRGVTDGIDVNVFVDVLRQLPMELDIIAEAVYGNSTTMDGRHFAGEFIRRKKLAEKGIVETQTSTSSSGNSGSTGGWSEVAKKGGSSGTVASQKEDAMPAGFKVVPSRKKGRK